MSLIKRVLGICNTDKPVDEGCWSFSDNRISVDLRRTGESLVRGGALRLEGKGLLGRVLLVHGLDGKYYALKNQCTHVGKRRIDPLVEQDGLKCCSVMGSVFTYDGKVVSGPAREPLTTYPVVAEADRLVITLT